MYCVRARAKAVMVSTVLWLIFACGIAYADGTSPCGGLYDVSVIGLDPGMHTDDIYAVAVDAIGTTAVTASLDKTIRVWEAKTGALQWTIHLPLGPGSVGMMFAAAISPDGGLVAAGGCTANQNSIYLINPIRGKIVGRIDGVRGATWQLAFSTNGRFLAAAGGGLRIFDRDKNWEAIASDDSSGEVFAVSFAADDRLATAGRDGNVRLYDGHFKLVHHYFGQQGVYPQSLAFNRDGSVLAVTYRKISEGHTSDPGTTSSSYFGGPPIATSGPNPVLLDGKTLTRLADPQLAEYPGYKEVVSWSRDRDTLLLSLKHNVEDVPGEVLACGQSGLGPCKVLAKRLGSDIDGITPLPDGGLIVSGSRRPYLASLNADGNVLWEKRSPIADFQGFYPLQGVAADGTTVDFEFQPGGQIFRFDITKLQIVDGPKRKRASSPNPFTDPHVNINGGRATVGERPIAIDGSEPAEIFAIGKGTNQFAVGTNFSLYLFKADGELVWRHNSTGEKRGLQITDNGSLVVAALGDGTIRWYRSDTGVELLALAPLALTQNTSAVEPSVTASTLDWVAWTPDGFYTATPSADPVLNWVTNQGPDVEALAVTGSDIPGLRRPDVPARVLRDRDIRLVVGDAELLQVRSAIQIATDAQHAAGPRLHVLAVGINYGPDPDPLHLDYAEKDAEDVTNTLFNTQGKASG
jgi:hypothetical protein